MNVLSLFDGCSGARLALTRANKKIDKYYTCEIDKYSSMVTKLNFPDTIALGDVTKVNFEMLPKIDLLIGGSPCQDLSFAKGNGKGLEGERSGLFYKYFEALEVLRKKNPEIKFLLENVKMKKKYENRISNLMGVQPIMINSNLLSAQNRKRLYWTNIPDVTIPKDKSIFLKDILEESTTSCALGIRAKSKCVRVGGNKSPFYSKQEWDSPFIRTDKKLKEKYGWYKAGCLTGGAHSGGNHSDMDLLLFRNMECRRYTVLECERLQTVPDNYTKCGQKENGDIVEISNTQRYKMLGNGFTINVIAHIIKNL